MKAAGSGYYSSVDILQQNIYFKRLSLGHCALALSYGMILDQVVCLQIFHKKNVPGFRISRMLVLVELCLSGRDAVSRE